MTHDPDDSAPWVTGDYADPAARLIWLKRQQRVADGWHPQQWEPPAARTMTGDAARDVQELRDWLALQAAVGALIDVEIFHEDL